MLYLESIVEVSEIAIDATKECCVDLIQWLGKKVAEADSWLADYGDN